MERPMFAIRSNSSVSSRSRHVSTNLPPVPPQPTKRLPPPNRAIPTIVDASRQQTRHYLYVTAISICILFVLTVMTKLYTHSAAFKTTFRPIDISIPPASPKISQLVNPALPPIALCLAGQLRSFHLFPVRHSIAFHLLQPLRDAGYPVHTFFHVGHTDVSIKYLTTLPNMFSPFGPASFSFFETSDTCDVRMCANNKKTICPHTLLRSDQCMKQVERYERSHNLTFEWIYRSRPDIMLASNMSLPRHLNTRTLYANMHMAETSEHARQWLRRKFPRNADIVQKPLGDLVQIVPRQIAHVVFSSSQAFRNCELFSFENGTIGPEVGLTYWLVKYGVVYQTLPWFWIIYREHGGPVCDNIASIHSGNDTVDRFMWHVCSSLKRTGVLPP